MRSDVALLFIAVLSMATGSACSANDKGSTGIGGGQTGSTSATTGGDTTSGSGGTSGETTSGGGETGGTGTSGEGGSGGSFGTGGADMGGSGGSVSTDAGQSGGTGGAGGGGSPDCAAKPCHMQCVFHCPTGDERCTGPNRTVQGECDGFGVCTPPWAFPPVCE